MRHLESGGPQQEEPRPVPVYDPQPHPDEKILVVWLGHQHIWARNGRLHADRQSTLNCPARITRRTRQQLSRWGRPFASSTSLNKLGMVTAPSDCAGCVRDGQQRRRVWAGVVGVGLVLCRLAEWGTKTRGMQSPCRGPGLRYAGNGESLDWAVHRRRDRVVQSRCHSRVRTKP